MKILIINRWNTSNLGDQAIGYAMESLCKKYGDIEHVDLCTLHSKRIIVTKPLVDNNVNVSHKASFVSKILKLAHLSWLDYMWYHKNRRLFECLQKTQFDYVFIGGGELIGPGAFSVALKYWGRQICKWQPNAKVIFWSVGVASNCTSRDVNNMRSILEHSKAIYVRDGKSQANLEQKWGLHSIEIPDVVFSQSTMTTEQRLRHGILYGITSFSRLQKHQTLYLSSEQEYFEYSLQQIISMNSDSVKLFYTTQDDLYACQRFQNYCDNRGYNIEIASYDNLQGLKEEIVRAETLCSPRMHACILGLLAGTKVIPVLISPKMESFNNKYMSPIYDNNSNRNILENIFSNVINS